MTVAAYAQTADEIVARMDQEMEKFTADDALAMTMDIKIPILGTFSSYARSKGDKMYMEVTAKGKKIRTWLDGETEYDYDEDENVITIKRRDRSKASDEEKNMEMFKSATEGYDVSISKETDTAWYIRCKKNKTNTNKDDPKNMDLVVAKGSYLPISLSAKMSGITVTMRNLKFNVSEKDVTFNQADFPGAKIVDQR